MVTVETQTFYYLMVALAIGLLVGVERGWQDREAQEGRRVAGVRTYGLIGLLGGVTALLSKQFGALVLGLGFIGLAGMMSVVYLVKLKREDDVGITSLIAALLTFILAALATLGQVSIASASAVVTVLLLSHKPQLHRWLTTLQGEELRAGIKLLLISVVLLPILPDQGYGPWQVLNPYRIWWMVVLIAIISFLGYFAIKIGGTRRGIIFTGLFGGLASSTAVTLHLARMARRNNEMIPVIATGTLVACGTMFIRMLLVTSILNIQVFWIMLLPIGLMAVLTYIPVFLFWRHPSLANMTTTSVLKNPLELKPALSFGLILVLVMLLSVFLQKQFGNAGVLTLAAVSGIADVDAILLSLIHMSYDGLDLHIVVMGAVIAAAMNSLLKGMMSMAIGGNQLGVKVFIPLLASAIVGVMTTWLLIG